MRQGSLPEVSYRLTRSLPEVPHLEGTVKTRVSRGSPYPKKMLKLGQG